MFDINNSYGKEDTLSLPRHLNFPVSFALWKIYPCALICEQSEQISRGKSVEISKRGFHNLPFLLYLGVITCNNRQLRLFISL